MIQINQYLKYLPSILIVLGIFLLAMLFLTAGKEKSLQSPKPALKIKSIDTMKYSRDLAREKADDFEFDKTISRQVFNIAQTGATHIAIGTPYDKEFIPFLGKWVAEARKNKLKVWFRGNLSGWERWFDYPAIDPQTHVRMVGEFIQENPDLFENGDIFTPCSECENGGPGDPRQTGDTVGFRKFLTLEYSVSKKAFEDINKKVETGYFSMNYDVAKLIMDEATTKSLGGIVAIDHYVASPIRLSEDARSLALQSKGKIVFGELGAPVADINGKMTEGEQADWIDQALASLNNNLDVIGINYWVSVGGTTEIWDENGNPKKAVEIIRRFYLTHAS